MTPRLAALMLCALAAGACAHASKKSPARAGSDERSAHCARAAIDRRSPYHVPLAEPVTSADDVALLADFPPEARRAARAAGLEPLLVSALRERDRSRGQPTPQLLSMQLELSVRLTALDAQLTAIAFEADCTTGQIREVLSHLEDREHSRQLALAIASLIVAAGTTSIAAALTIVNNDDTRIPAIFSLAGGVATGVLGGAALRTKDPHVELTHEENLLSPVIAGEDPQHLYPTFVFRMLTLPDDGPRGSPRARLVEEWSGDFDDVHTERAAAERLMYGRGGAYDLHLVEARVHHFEQLSEALQSISRDLELMDRYLVRRFFGPSAPPPQP